MKRYKPNDMKMLWRVVINSVLILYSLLCTAPFLLVLAVSLTDENSLALEGYKFIPKKFSLQSYQYVLSEGQKILSAYGVTITVTVVGTLLALTITSMFAYAISRSDFKYRRFFANYIVITMLFSGGLVPWYLVCVQFLHLKDTILALIVPYLVNAYNVIILRSFFRTSVPESIIHSAKLDGAGEFRIFFSIVTWISLPGLATIGLFIALNYWNDWWLPMLLVDKQELMNLQFLLYKIQNNLAFLTSGMVKSNDISGEVAKLPTESARMAMAILAAGPIILLSSFLQKYFIKGLTIGSLKG